MNYRFGRRRTTQLPIALVLIFSIVVGVSSNVYIYMISQFIVAAAFGGYRINSVVLGMSSLSLNKISWLQSASEAQNLSVVALQWLCGIHSVGSYRVDRGLQKILSLLSESGVRSFWAVCHGRPCLCYPWLENGAVCHSRGAGLCFLVHMVCVLSFCRSAAFEQLPTSWSFLTGHTPVYSVTITEQAHTKNAFVNWPRHFRWIPESARWLLGQGKTEEAKQLILRVAAINKRKIPENLLVGVSQIQVYYIWINQTFNSAWTAMVAVLSGSTEAQWCLS